MNRRFFLRATAFGAVIGVTGAGFWGRNAYAKEALRLKLVSDSAPILDAKARVEIQSLPNLGRDQIKAWFDGQCLNVNSFVNTICSENYRTALQHCCPDDQKARIKLSFQSKVTNESRIMLFIEQNARAVGSQLDESWVTCSKSISEKWRVPLSAYSRHFDLERFHSKVNPIIREQLQNALSVSRGAVGAPTVTDSVSDICATVLMLGIQNKDRIGAGEFRFVTDLFSKFAASICDSLQDLKSDLQTVITEDVALLGSRIAAAWETEIRIRVADLQRWQESSVGKVAADEAHSAVGMF